MSKVASVEVDDDAQVAVNQALSLVGRFDKARIGETPVVVKVEYSITKVEERAIRLWKLLVE